MSAPAASADVKQADAAHAARSGAVQFLTTLGQGLLAITHVLLAHLYGRAAFGVYQSSVAVLEVLTRGAVAGADKGMLRYVAAARARNQPDEAASAIGTGLRLSAAVGICAAILLALLAPVLGRISSEPGLAVSLPRMAPAIVFTGAMLVLVQASLGAKRTRQNLYVRGLGEPTLYLAAGVLAYLVGGGLARLAIGHAVAALSTLLLAWWLIDPVFGRGQLRASLHAPWLKGFARFSVPLGAAELLNAVLQRADILMLTSFVGAEATAIYAAAEYLTRVVANVRYAFDSIAAAVLSEALHLSERQRLDYNLKLMTRWVASLAAPIASTMVVLRSDLLSLYGSAFTEGSRAMLILALGHFTNAWMGLAGWVLVVSGRSRLILVNNIVGATLNIGLGLLLIPRFGVVGTAVSALGTVVVLQVVGIIEVYATERVHPLSLGLLKPFAAGILAGLAQALVAAHITLVWGRVPAAIGVGAVTYALAMLALRLPAEERDLVAKALAKVRRQRR